jgi:hypothetical protein
VVSSAPTMPGSLHFTLTVSMFVETSSATCSGRTSQYIVT